MNAPVARVEMEGQVWMESQVMSVTALQGFMEPIAKVKHKNQIDYMAITYDLSYIKLANTVASWIFLLFASLTKSQIAIISNLLLLAIK